MKIERELMRGAGPVAVLKLLAGGAKYGYELVEALSAQTAGILAMGQSTLYPMLYNLEAQGLIVGNWASSPSGRDRKYYSLTPAGQKRLAHDSEQWQAVVQALSSLGVLPSTSRVATIGGVA
ncbi:MAG: PadR family transcriptional regulator [Planctomycetota bacterium]